MSETSTLIPAEPSAESPSLESSTLGLLEWMAGQLSDLEERSRELTEEHERLDEQIRLASQVQKDLLPKPDFRMHGACVHTLYRPVDRVSGDIYDIARLDETHVGISLADATGHGMPAALLTVFIKQSFRGKEIFNGSYRIVPPNEILSRLNRDILDVRLSQCRFVTALHAVYDEQRRHLTFARGGVPYPVHIPKDGPARQIVSHGGLVGTFDGAAYETVELDLHPGDKVLLFTDGLDALLTAPALQDWAQDVTQTDWFQDLANRSAEQVLQSIDDRLRGLAADDWHSDDVTVVVLEIEA